MVYKEIKSNYEFKEATKNGLAVVYFKSTWCKYIDQETRDRVN